MRDLVHEIHAQLAGFGCCEGYRNPGLDQARAAVLAALGFHPYTPTGIVDEKVYDENGSFRMTRPKMLAVCNTCNVAYPCNEVRAIATVLGVEVADDAR